MSATFTTQILVLFLSLFCIQQVIAQEIIGSAGQGMSIVRNEHSKIGFANTTWADGRWIFEVKIPYRFDWASEFNDLGYSVVEIAGRYGVIDKTGKTVVPVEFDYAFNIQNGISVVYRAGKFGAVDITGKLVIPFEYEHLGPFDRHGYASAHKWGQNGIIDKRNAVRIPFNYISASSSDNHGYTLVLTVSGRKNLDPNGKEVFPGYVYVEGQNGGYVAVAKESKAYGLFSESGQQILPEEYESIEVGRDGKTTILRKNGKYGLFDLTKKSWLISLNNEHIKFLGDNLVVVHSRFGTGPAYLTDLAGRKVLPTEYQAIVEDNRFDGIGYEVKKDGKWGLIDHKGNIVLPTQFAQDSISITYGVVKDSILIAARLADDPSCKPACGWGLTDLKGKVILPFRYGKPGREFFSRKFTWERTENPFLFYSGGGRMYAAVLDLETMKPGIADNTGWILSEPYDDFSLIFAVKRDDNGTHFIPVKKGSQWGLFNLKTRREVVPPSLGLDSDGFGSPSDKYKYAHELYRDVDAWGILVYETGQVFKPGNYSYESYHNEPKLLEVAKSGTSSNIDVTSQIIGESGKLVGLMRLDGTMVTKIQYSKLSYDSEIKGFWAVKNGKGGWIDTNGRTIIEHKFDLWTRPRPGELVGREAGNSFDRYGFANVIHNGEMVVIDTKGNVVKRVTELGADRGARFGDSREHKFRYFHAWDDLGEKVRAKYLINSSIYDCEQDIGRSFGPCDGVRFREDLAVLKRNGKYGYIDRTGKEVIPFTYHKASDFNDGIALVETDKEAFLINRNGERLYQVDGLTVLARQNRGFPPFHISEVVRSLDVIEAKKEYDSGAIFVDTRTAESYAGERVKGAINVPRASVADNVARLPKNSKIIAYCTCPREEASGAVILELRKLGYTEVYALRGGTNAWKEAGYPMEK